MGTTTAHFFFGSKTAKGVRAIGHGRHETVVNE
jgi:hypothetical protein